MPAHESPPVEPGMPKNDTASCDPSVAGVVWLRPEFIGRESELVTLADGADAVGVTRGAVSNWMTRHRDCPALVRVTGSPRHRTKWVVLAELVEFARTRRDTSRHRPRAAARPRRAGAQIAAEQIEHCQRVLAELTARERRQTEALTRTHDARRAVEAKLAAARVRLADEVAAATKYASGC